MNNQPPGTPWRGQHGAPPPPPFPAPVSPSATAELPVTGARGWWARLNPLPKALLVLATVAGVSLFLCCGVAGVVGALSADPEQESPDGNAAEAPVATESASPSPTVVTRIVIETEEIPFEEEVVEDPSLLEGTEEVRTDGVAGELTVTFEVTYTNGEEADRRKVGEEVTREPVNEVIVVGTGQPEPEPEPEADPEEEAGSNCHPDYSGACVPTGVSDVDCAGGSGNGPAYVRGPVYIGSNDPYDLDRDGDGVACE